MAAYTDTLGFNKGTAAYPANVTDISKFQVELDFAAIVAARSAAARTDKLLKRAAGRREARA